MLQAFKFSIFGSFMPCLQQRTHPNVFLLAIADNDLPKLQHLGTISLSHEVNYSPCVGTLMAIFSKSPSVTVLIALLGEGCWDLTEEVCIKLRHLQALQL